MNQKLNITYFKPEKQGAFPVDNGYCFATEIQSLCESGLILYSRNGKKYFRNFFMERYCGIFSRRIIYVVFSL